MLLYLLIFSFACNQGADNQKVAAENVYLYIKTQGLGLREAAGEKSKLIKRLTAGERVIDLGKVSDFTSKVKFDDKWLDEPWLYVQTSDNKKGWVYAGGVSLLNSDTNTAYHFWADKQLNALFGNLLFQKIINLRKAYFTIKTDKEFARFYGQSDSLRYELCSVLTDKVVMDENGVLPSYSYLEMAIPGYTVSYVAEGSLLFLFKDYKAWLALAQKTTGNFDDDFLKFELSTSTDSIEFYIHNWDMMLSDVEAASLLGDGKHLGSLKSIEKQSVAQNPLLPFLQKYKEELVNDICGVSTALYWNNYDKIISELISILNSNFKILTSNDIVALQTRLKTFERKDPNLQVNLRAGGD